MQRACGCALRARGSLGRPWTRACARRGPRRAAVPWSPPESRTARGRRDRAIPRDGTLLGALFESLVTQSVKVYAQAAETSVGHLRLKGGTHELDLIVDRGDGRVVAIEVKLSATVRNDAVKHL